MTSIVELFWEACKKFSISAVFAVLINCLKEPVESTVIRAGHYCSSGVCVADRATFTTTTHLTTTAVKQRLLQEISKRQRR